MTDLEILLSTRQLLLNPSRWMKGALWEQRPGVWTLPGALLRVQQITNCDLKRVVRALELEIDLSGAISLADFNNAKGTTHHRVITLLECALRSFGYDGRLDPFEDESE